MYEEQIKRAQELLRIGKHACMATVNEDGSPHNTPFRLIYDPELTYIYWGSYPESLHSLNVLRTGKIFVVLFDLIQKGGLYIKCENGYPLDGDELKKGLEIFNAVRSKEGSDPLTIDYYTGNSPQRMWRALITNFWVNSGKRDRSGNIVKDSRQEIMARDLLN